MWTLCSFTDTENNWSLKADLCWKTPPKIQCNLVERSWLRRKNRIKVRTSQKFWKKSRRAQIFLFSLSQIDFKLKYHKREFVFKNDWLHPLSFYLVYRFLVLFKQKTCLVIIMWGKKVANIIKKLQKTLMIGWLINMSFFVYIHIHIY